MQPADENVVLGDFSGTKYIFGKRTSRFFVKDGKYLIETLNDQGKQQTYPVRYVFGYRPLQQYLLETEPGRLQAFDVAWDTRPGSEGGQRWYQLQDESVTDPEHPFSGPVTIKTGTAAVPPVTLPILKNNLTAKPISIIPPGRT